MFKTDFRIVTVFVVIALLNVSFHFLGKITLSIFDLISWIIVLILGGYCYYLYYTWENMLKKRKDEK